MASIHTTKPSATTQHVAVIGAGVAGLATAALLSRAGYRVTLIDEHDQPGGRAYRLSLPEAPGFWWDAGPSWYLMPEAFDHFYELMGTTTRQELTLTQLDPAYRLIPHRGTSIDIPATREKVYSLFDKLDPGSGTRLQNYLRSAGVTYTLALEWFLYTTFTSLKGFYSPAVLRRLPSLVECLTTPLKSKIATVTQHPQLQQILGYPAVFLASEPDRIPSLYHLMSHTDLDQGVFYPQGGFSAVIDSIVALAQANGVQFLANTQVTAITTRPLATRSLHLPQPVSDRLARIPGGGQVFRQPTGTVTGVQVLGDKGQLRHIDADIVISCADIHHTETSLLPSQYRSWPMSHWSRIDPGPSCVVVYLGVKGSLPQLCHHTLLFSNDWSKDFHTVYRRVCGDDLPRSKSIYVSNPSKTDATVAPIGHENLFILIPVPADVAIGAGSLSGNEHPLVRDIANAAICQLAAWAHIPDLMERIVVRATSGPADFATRYHSYSASALGYAHTLKQSAFLRGINESLRLEGLYYAGSTTLPGVGIPMCLISAENIVKRLTGDKTTTPLPTPL